MLLLDLHDFTESIFSQQLNCLSMIFLFMFSNFQPHVKDAFYCRPFLFCSSNSIRLPMSKQLHMLKFYTSLTHVILIKRYINFTSCLHNVNKYSCPYRGVQEVDIRMNTFIKSTCSFMKSTYDKKWVILHSA